MGVKGPLRGKSFSGGLPALESIFAPIISSGSMIRFIGLDVNDASPVIWEAKFCPANNPASIRMVDPLLPQSRASADSVNPFKPLPIISTMLPSREMDTPSRRKQSRVEAQSSLAE